MTTTDQATSLQQFLLELGGSYDLSAKLRAWHDAGGVYAELARDLPADPAIISDYALRPDDRTKMGRRRHRNVPARYIPRLAELMETTLEELLDGVLSLPAPPAPPTAAPAPPPERPSCEPAPQPMPAPPVQVYRRPPVVHIHCLLCGREASAPGRCLWCGGFLLVERLTPTQEATPAARLARQQRGPVLWEGFTS